MKCGYCGINHPPQDVCGVKAIYSADKIIAQAYSTPKRSILEELSGASRRIGMKLITFSSPIVFYTGGWTYNPPHVIARVETVADRNDMLRLTVFESGDDVFSPQPVVLVSRRNIVSMQDLETV